MTTKRLAYVNAIFILLIVAALAAKSSRSPDNLQESVTPHPPPTAGGAVSFAQAKDEINAGELKKNLYYLANDALEGRMSGKAGNRQAAEFIANEFRKCGLPVMFQKFPIRRTNPGPKNEVGDDFTQNVISWIDGENPDEVVVIGAHMDHIGYGPAMSRTPRRLEIHNGADDNASGTVALLAVAKAFSKVGKPKRTVIFQAYSAEEMGLIGSQYYCEHPLFPSDRPDIRKHIFMLNMDMVGYLKEGRYKTAWHAGDSSPDIAGIISRLNNEYAFAKDITSRGTGGSDHASFYNKKVPIAFLHTGLHPYYHTPDDDADKINYDGLEKVTKYAFELAWNVVQSEERPSFNHAKFVKMKYFHDHGHGHFHNEFGEHEEVDGKFFKNSRFQRNL